MTDQITVLLNAVGETRMKPTEEVWSISDRHARHFYDARREWAQEEYEELIRRGRERHGIDVEKLAQRGEEYVRENDIPGYEEGDGE